MLHPTYNDIMEVVNKDVIDGEEPVIKSRYSVVIAAAKRARQIIDGAPELISEPDKKPLSVAVDELYQGKVDILGEGRDEK
ncbi:MAG: DNA-directed RNA polymerase subunit omega [Eubacteriales bacterium]|nr:DNA-directed RNA polymerase subunit omega [Eubacteriales bacterium]